MAGSTARGALTRQRLVHAAADLFAERGVQGTGLDEVLRSAGASKSQLYHFFGDKRGLVLAVVEHQQQVTVEPLVAQLAGIGSRADLATWLAAVVDFHDIRGCRDGCPVGTLASELAQTDEGAREALSAAMGQWREGLAAAFGRLQQAGELPPDADLDVLARAALALLQGGQLLAKTDRSAASLRAATAACLALLDAPPRLHTGSEADASPAAPSAGAGPGPTHA